MTSPPSSTYIVSGQYYRFHICETELKPAVHKGNTSKQQQQPSQFAIPTTYLSGKTTTTRSCVFDQKTALRRAMSIISRLHTWQKEKNKKSPAKKGSPTFLRQLTTGTAHVTRSWRMQRPARFFRNQWCFLHLPLMKVKTVWNASKCLKVPIPIFKLLINTFFRSTSHLG